MNDWFDAERRAERSQRLFESQRWEEALSEIDAALAFNPSNSSWLSYRGFLLDSLDRVEEAIGAYESALALEPEDTDLLVALGIGLTRVGRHRRALSVFERLAALDPQCEASYCHRILNYGELGDHDRAEEMFYLAQQIHEDCPDCFFHVGLSLAARHSYQRAIFCWNRVLEIDPTYPGVKQHIARAHRAGGALSRAGEFYLAELREDPGSTDLLVEMGELAVEAGDLSAAAARFRQVLELEPDHQAASWALADVLLRNGDAKAALNLLLVLAETAPASAQLDERLGAAYLAAGQYEPARRHLESSAQRDQENESALLLLGICLLHLGKPAEADDAFNRMLVLNADSPSAHHNLAVCSFLQDDYERGLEHCLRAIELQPDYALAIQKATIACIQLGRWSQARQMIARGLALDPEDQALQQVSRRLWRFRCRHILLKLIRLPRSLLKC